MTDRVPVFISHISEEAPLAHSLKSWIEATFPDQVSVLSAAISLVSKLATSGTTKSWRPWHDECFHSNFSRETLG